MSADDSELTGPDLAAGLAVSSIPENTPFGGHVGGKPVVLVRRGNDVFALGGKCTHYGGPLAEGIVVGDTIRCPWHHACFGLRTGEATCAPALDPVARWEVEMRDGQARVTKERTPPDGATPITDDVSSLGARESLPDRIVIVGAGAAGHAAAEMLRRKGYGGKLTMIGADASVPYDRPNLSKDYLEGSADAAWIPLRPEEFFAQHDIELLRGTHAASIDAAERCVVLDDGRRVPFDRLLVTTGADPVHLPLPGADLPHVHYLRTLADSDAIIAGASHARRVLVMGASFIGLEVAASLRARGLEVHVVAPEAQPLARVLGDELGRFIRNTHEKHGVVFHLERTATEVREGQVAITGEGSAPGETVDADLVVIGVGVRPAIALAESAGAATDKGVVVDAYLETTVPGMYAAGDIARWPDPHTGQRIRVEHWVVAQRQGQTAARNMLGAREPYTAVPFFWSKHYDMSIRYVGHAEKWDDVVIDGDLAKGDAAVAFRSGGRTLAVATVGRDRLALEVEAAMERDDQDAIDRLLTHA